MSVALRQFNSVNGHSLRAQALDDGRALSGSIGITSKLPVDQRVALEQLLFFNVNQHRVRVGIQQSIETYGVPEIYEHEGGLRVRVGDIAGCRPCTRSPIWPARGSGGVRALGARAFRRIASRGGPAPELTPEVNTRCSSS